MVERMQTPGEGPGVVVEPIPVESARRDRPARRGVQHRQRRHRRRSPRSRPRCGRASPRCSSTWPAATRCCSAASSTRWTRWRPREEDPDVLEQPLHARPPGDPDAPQRREPAGARRHRLDPPAARRAAAVRRHPHRGRRDRVVRPHRPVDVRGPRRLRPARADRRAPARRAARERHPLLQPGDPGRRRRPRSPGTAST